MENRPDNTSVLTGFEMLDDIGLHNSYNIAISPYYPYAHGLRSSTYSAACEFDSSQSVENVTVVAASSDIQMERGHDPAYQIGACSDSMHQIKQSKTVNSGIGDKDTLRRPPFHCKLKGSFLEWKPRPSQGSLLQPQKNQSLHKRCIRLLNYINNHRIHLMDEKTYVSESRVIGTNVSHQYDKLAIHHVIAERKRRENMNDMFSALRALLPVDSQKGRATVLRQAIEYINHLKRRVGELEQRNRKLGRVPF